MSDVSPHIEGLARRLVAIESSRSASTADNTASARVCEKLRGELTAYVGAVGFRALISRAVSLAKARDHSLQGLFVHVDGKVAGFQPETPPPKDEHLLVAHLLQLLAIFIGEPLTLALVQNNWPEAQTQEHSPPEAQP
jgi:hypothetical protein